MKKACITLLLILTLLPVGLTAEDGNSMNKLANAQNISTISAGGLIAIESGLLLVGMNLPVKSSWSTLANNSFAISDILMGSTLVYYGLSGRDYSNDILYDIISTILIITHGYREVEYFTNNENAYCANTALFVFNNIRMGLLGTSITFSLMIK